MKRRKNLLTHCLETLTVQDLLAIFGGGERVGEAALRQTLGMATATPSDRPGAAKSVPGSRSDERAPEVIMASLLIFFSF